MNTNNIENTKGTRPMKRRQLTQLAVLTAIFLFIHWPLNAPPEPRIAEYPLPIELLIARQVLVGGDG